MRIPMKRACLCVVLAGLLLVGGCATEQWYKGNTHTHSFWSDGNDFPEMIALWYRDHDYDFLVMSDHNILMEGEKWIGRAHMERFRGQAALPKYLERLGEEWVVTRGEGDELEVRLKTLDETRALVETADFIMIQGEEISDHFERRPVHTNAMNLEEYIHPPGGDSIREVMRNTILAVREQAERLDRPILPHLNHPNFRYAITAEDLAYVLEEEFFEVYNGHPGVGHTGDDYHAPVERLWDIANTIRVAELEAPPLYGVAVDDAHHYHEGQNVTPGRGWIMVRAGSLDAASLIHAMRHGDFYGSSGVTLSDVRYNGKSLTVIVDPEPDTQYTIEFIGTLRGYDDTAEPQFHPEHGHPITGKYSDEVGAVLHSVTGTRATYRLTGDELYVRAAVRSSRPPANPAFRGQVAEAWTQPVGWERHVDDVKARHHFHHHHHSHSHPHPH